MKPSKQQILNSDIFAQFYFIDYMQQYKKFLQFFNQRLHKMPQFIDKLNPDQFKNIIKYLNAEDMFCLLNSMKRSHKQSYEMYVMILKISLTFAKYLNKIDRPYFYDVFGNKQFKNQEYKQISNIKLTQQNQILFEFPDKFQNILRLAANQIPRHFRSEFCIKIRQLMFSPIISLPRLMRQGTSALTNTSYQQFLSIRGDSDNFKGNIFQKIFFSIRQYIKSQLQKFTRQISLNRELIKNFHKNAHTITFTNYTTFLLRGNNNIHNIFVYLFALTQLYLSAIQTYLNTIEEPFALLVHLTMKYTQFSNMLLCFQQNLSDIFIIYEQLYQNSIGVEKIPFSYWRPAMNMWIDKMSKFHQTTNESFTDLNLNIINEKLTKSISSGKTISLRSQIYQKISQLNKQNKNQSSFMYQKMKQYKNQFKILHNNYQQYLVDISVNQVSVHFCSHSQQKLDIFYEDMQNILINKERKYYLKLKSIALSAGQYNQLKQVIKKRLGAYDYFCKKPTLKKLIKQYQKQSISIQMQKMMRMDKEVQNYIRYLVRNKKINLEDNGRPITQFYQKEQSTGSSEMDLQEKMEEETKEVFV